MKVSNEIPYANAYEGDGPSPIRTIPGIQEDYSEGQSENGTQEGDEQKSGNRARQSTHYPCICKPANGARDRQPAKMMDNSREHIQLEKQPYHIWMPNDCQQTKTTNAQE